MSTGSEKIRVSRSVVRSMLKFSRDGGMVSGAKKVAISPWPSGTSKFMLALMSSTAVVVRVTKVFLVEVARFGISFN